MQRIVGNKHQSLLRLKFILSPSSGSESDQVGFVVCGNEGRHWFWQGLHTSVGRGAELILTDYIHRI